MNTFNSIQELTIVNGREVRVKLTQKETRQKIVSAVGNDPKKYFSRDNLLVIGASMCRTKSLNKDYPALMKRLHNTLYNLPYPEVPSRQELSDAITDILKRWDRDCEDCEKPFSYELLKDKKVKKMVKSLVSKIESLSS